jgi:ubiquinone biosynthesis protein Coq4
MKDYSYFHKGIKPVATSSSMLVSSSKFLNNARLRDWMTTHFLRRNGQDQPLPPDVTLGLVQALEEIRDVDQVLALIEREKQINPKFAAWIQEGFLSQLTKDDFSKFPRETLGGAFYQYLVDFNFELNLGMGTLPKPKNDLEFIFYRFSQIHDFEHLVSGGQFNSLGELLPYFVRLSNTHQHMSAELAQFFCETYIFGGMRMVMRTALHYPSAWLTVVDLMQRGFAIGLASDSILMMRYEDALDLSIPEARIKLGVRNAEDVDTRIDDEVFIEKRPPTSEELKRIGRPDLARTGRLGPRAEGA